MKTYRFWARASAPVQDHVRQWKVDCYGGSNASIEEALQRATVRAEAAAAAIASGREPERYAYSDRPLREEIIREIKRGGETVAVLTRNSYGSLVINTARVLFADIDYEPDGESGATIEFRLPGFMKTFFAFIASVFGQDTPERPHVAQPKKPAKKSQDEQIVDRVREVVDNTRGLGVRLYRTANGFRCLVTSDTWEPLSAETNMLLRDFGSDPLYVTLCTVQECFRARLSPKPFRCGVVKPPSRFPWPDASTERIYRDWEQDYERATKSYSTCAFIGAFGNPDIHPDVQPILDIHDEFACDGDGPIA